MGGLYLLSKSFTFMSTTLRSDRIVFSARCKSKNKASPVLGAESAAASFFFFFLPLDESESLLLPEPSELSSPLPSLPDPEPL